LTSKRGDGDSHADSLRPGAPNETIETRQQLP
jgi:hypothetical protein